MHVIVRTINAGVFAGELGEQNGDTVTLRDARRLWYWVGAATLSQLAVDGTSRPSQCKFPTPVDSIMLFGVIEIAPTTEKARDSINSVPVWAA